MSADCDFYINTFDEYLKTNNDEDKKAYWKMRSILDLMKLTQGKDKGDLCENGLRLIILLHNNYKIYPFDINDDCPNQQSFINYDEILSILKSEFI